MHTYICVSFSRLYILQEPRSQPRDTQNNCILIGVHADQAVFGNMNDNNTNNVKSLK